MSNLTPHTSHPKYRPDIDGLRAFSVLAVVIYHAFPSTLRGGFIGVDVFFVISGFLISTIIFENLNKGTFSFLDFYIRRTKRIFPALILVLISSYALGWQVLFPDEFKQLGKHIAAAAGFVSNLILWQDIGYFDNAAETKPLLHLWSLGIEEQFYLIWPLLLWLVPKKRISFLILVITAIIISFYLNVSGIHIDSTATFYSPQTRFWELLCGSLLAWMTLYKKGSISDSLNHLNSLTTISKQNRLQKNDYRIFANLCSITGLLLLLAGIGQIKSDINFPGVQALVPVLGAVLIISAGSQSWINRVVLSNRLAVWFGLISYPLYLWHWPLLSFVRIIEGQFPNRTLRLSAVILSIVLAWLTYKFIERPLRFGQGGKKLTVGLLLTLVIVGILGYVTYLNEGFPSRKSVKVYHNNTKELILQSNRNDECLRYTNIQDPIFSFCKFSNVGSSETVAVIGDSLARSAFDGIAEVLKEQKVNTVLLANSACPPLIDAPVTGVTFNAADRALCNKRINQLLETLVAKKDIKKVFFFARGTIYFTGKEPVTGEAIVCDQISIESYKAGAQKTIDMLRSHGKEIFWVTENPELHIDPRACLTRPLKTNTRDCSLNKTTVLERQKQNLAMINSLKGITVINPLQTFCPNEKCIVFDKNGTLLYYDDDHLSVSGSHFLAKKLLYKYLTN